MKRLKLAAVLIAGTALSAFAAAPALALTSSPQWTVTSVSRPTNFAPGDKSGSDSYSVLVTNTGDATAEGSPIVIVDELPAGLSLDSLGASGENSSHTFTPPDAKTAAFDCTFAACTYSGKVVPGQTLELAFPVDVAESPPPSCEVPAGAVSCVTNVVRVSGGGAPAVASVSTPTTISSTPAGFGIPPGGADTSLSSTQAGAHPDLTTSIAFDTVNAKGALAAAPKDTIDDLPPGYAGDLIDTASCSAALFALEECPIGSQIGVATIIIQGVLNGTFTEPVYNIDPNTGEVGKLGFSVIRSFLIEGGISVRPGDYGLRATFTNTNELSTEIDNVSLTIWGVPADPIHNPLRASEVFGSTIKWGGTSNAPRAPFFTNPTSCSSEPLQAAFTVNSWEEPQRRVTAQMPFGPTVGCDRLTIEPEVEVVPTSTSAYSPTGLNVHMKIPQTYDNPDGLATSHLRDVKVTLPEGMSLNPSAGSGLGSCTEAQFAYEGSTAEPAPGLGCPNESKIGTVHVRSPSLSEEATGSLFVAKPFENRFGLLLALYLIARIPNRGVVVAAAGEVHSDPVSGRLTTTFAENPKLPFSDFTLSFRQGATSPLVTPPVCGSFTTEADLTPWSVPDQHHFPPISPFLISRGVRGGPCPGAALAPFQPLLHAGSYSNQAGAYSPFYIRLSREDGEQEITHFSIKLPPGLLGKLAGVPLCSDAAIAGAKGRTGPHGGQEEEEHPSCPAASEVGRTEVEAGVGTVLASAPGKVYLAGAYHGSPISVAAITAARVGPFDLGTVVVREALKIDPETGEVSVDATGSDPLPHIIQGIPTHLRNIRIYMDKPEFVLNPTSCDRTSTASTVLGSGKDFVSEADDNPITVSSFFQAANCAALGFKPKLRFSLKGGTRRSQVPAFKAVLTARKGDANIAHAEVILPTSEQLEQSNVGLPCTRVQFAEGGGNGEGCPQSSILGRARAVTPILSEPLEGPVIFRSNGGERKVPDIVAALHGQEINIDLVGWIDSVLKHNKRGEVTSARIRNRFMVVPDAPVKKFTLELFGGKRGLLVNTTNLCRGRHEAEVKLTAHNGKADSFKAPLKARCGKKGKGRKKRQH